MSNAPNEIEYVVTDPLTNERVDRVISFFSGLSRSKVSELVSNGLVKKNGIPVKKGSEKTLKGDVLLFPSPEGLAPNKLEPDSSVNFSVVFEDDHIVVVNKPPGVVVHPGSGRESGTLVNGLLARYPDMKGIGEEDRLGLVHRLDKGTSGLLLVARTDAALENLKKQMENREIGRQYYAILCGHLSSAKGLIEAPLGRDPKNPLRRTVTQGGKDARTHYQIKERYDHPIKVTTVECILETGRTHQIRAHFSAINHPVLGDQIYGGKQLAHKEIRPALHAEKIDFQHPTTGKKLSFVSNLPTDLVQIIESFS
tara:strand:- start:107 stop:1039 length:933 start_codon:yes stop_codon:yes gene_type:complete